MARRLLSLLTMLLLVQLTLVGAASRCPLAPSGTGAGHGSSHEHAASSHGHGAQEQAPASDGQRSLPGCAGASMCAVVVIPARATVVDAPPLRVEPRLVARGESPQSVTRSPELPPPRG